MLRVESEKQAKHIVSLLGRTSIIDQDENGIYIDDYISFDEIAMIVDYLRAKKNIKCFAYSRFICIFAFA